MLAKWLEAQGTDLESLLTHYHENKFVLLKNFIDSAQATDWFLETAHLPAKRVMCGKPNVRWDQQRLTAEQKVYRFLTSSTIQSLMLLLENQLKFQDKLRVVAWTCSYKLGEYIDEHRDKGGDIQAILCLQAPPAENGGTLMVQGTDHYHPISLSAGDFFIFKAVSVFHYTVPLIASATHPEPIRVIAVARYLIRLV